MQLQRTRPNRLTIAAKTGQHAPSSGWWGPEDDPLQVRYLQQGEMMPALLGAQTLWILQREAPFVNPSSWSTHS